MNKLRIHIDYVGSSTSQKLASRIMRRLRPLASQVNLFSHEHSADENKPLEKAAIEELKKSDIIIPILSSDYLAFITPNLSRALDAVAESNDKFLFPVYLRVSDWSSFRWVVKSKLFPSEGMPFEFLWEDEINKVLNELAATITQIVAQYGERGQTQAKFSNAPNPGKNKYVFISHDRDNSDFAELFKLRLEKINVVGWLDTERLKVGQDWREEIDSGITDSLAVVVIMTPDARKSEYVTYEWAYAWGKKKKIFPIMLKQTPLHPRLESLQYLDFTNKASRPWETLMSSIRDLAK